MAQGAQLLRELEIGTLDEVCPPIPFSFLSFPIFWSDVVVVLNEFGEVVIDNAQG